jgi:hypothetical protein
MSLPEMMLVSLVKLFAFFELVDFVAEFGSRAARKAKESVV